MHICVVLKPCEITNMIYFSLFQVVIIHYFWKSMLMRNKICLQVFLLSNIL